jgi:hypothetical protein
MKGPQNQIAVYTGRAKPGKEYYPTKEEYTNANGKENYLQDDRQRLAFPCDVSFTGQTCRKLTGVSVLRPPPLVVRHFVTTVSLGAIMLIVYERHSTKCHIAIYCVTNKMKSLHEIDPNSEHDDKD